MKPKPELDRWEAGYELDVKPLEKWEIPGHDGIVSSVQYDKEKDVTVVWVDRNF